MKRIYVFCFLFLAGLHMSFAQSFLPPGMNTLADNVMDIFKSPFIKVVLAIFLCGSAVTYAFNKDNDKVKKNCIAVGISSAILVVAQQVFDKIFSAAGG